MKWKVRTFLTRVLGSIPWIFIVAFWVSSYVYHLVPKSWVKFPVLLSLALCCFVILLLDLYLMIERWSKQDDN